MDDDKTLVICGSCYSLLPTNSTIVDSGALKMAINVLRRAGKNEIADELLNTAIKVK